MLGGSALMAFIRVNDAAAARTLYESTLGLPVVDDRPFALVVDAHGTKIRITPVPRSTPAAVHHRGLAGRRHRGDRRGSQPPEG